MPGFWANVHQVIPITALRKLEKRAALENYKRSKTRNFNHNPFRPAIMLRFHFPLLVANPRLVVLYLLFLCLLTSIFIGCSTSANGPQTSDTQPPASPALVFASTLFVGDQKVTLHGYSDQSLLLSGRVKAQHIKLSGTFQRVADTLLIQWADSIPIRLRDRYYINAKAGLLGYWGTKGSIPIDSGRWAKTDWPRLAKMQQSELELLFAGHIETMRGTVYVKGYSDQSVLVVERWMDSYHEYLGTFRRDSHRVVFQFKRPRPAIIAKVYLIDKHYGFQREDSRGPNMLIDSGQWAGMDWPQSISMEEAQQIEFMNALSGEWVSTTDALSSLKVRYGRWQFCYQGKVLDPGPGYRIYWEAPSTETLAAHTEGHLSLVDGNDTLRYDILVLNDSIVTLMYLPRGNIEAYRKKE